MPHQWFESGQHVVSSVLYSLLTLAEYDSQYSMPHQWFEYPQRTLIPGMDMAASYLN